MNLIEIQQKLKAPKGQTNSFGGYKYRSCEDILEAVKPLLGENILLLYDEIVNIGNNNYVKATAEFRQEGCSGIKVTAFAREAITKRGMDDAQITGSASSYARKYALNGLFLIDDTKDADSQDNQEKEPSFDDEVKEKMKIMLEENMDGAAANMEHVQKVLWARFKKYPDSEDAAKKAVAYMVEHDMLNSIKEK